LPGRIYENLFYPPQSSTGTRGVRRNGKIDEQSAVEKHSGCAQELHGKDELPALTEWNLGYHRASMRENCPGMIARSAAAVQQADMEQATNLAINRVHCLRVLKVDHWLTPSPDSARQRQDCEGFTQMPALTSTMLGYSRRMARNAAINQRAHPDQSGTCRREMALAQHLSISRFLHEPGT